jgi:hypothetical protein
MSRTAAFFGAPDYAEEGPKSVQKQFGPSNQRTNNPETEKARQATLDASAKEAKAKRPSPLGGGK